MASGRRMPNEVANFAGAKKAWRPVKSEAEAKIKVTARKLEARFILAMLWA